MHPLKTTNPKAVAEKLAELYITTRYRYLMQTPTTYVELNRWKNEKVWPLITPTLTAHLDGKNAYGVFDANGMTKFMTFDVDFNEAAAAKWHTYRLLDVLCEDFGISRDDLHVSLSGGKGYHVDLFFDKTIPTESAATFHAQVMQKLGAINGGDIEFRPTWAQGVKLPLGVHQRTGARCYFCNAYTLEPIESLDYVLGIEPMSSEIILDALIELTPEQEREFAEVERKTNANITAVDASQVRQKAASIIDAGRLTQSNTRHNSTFMLAAFFNAQGFEPEEAVDAIMAILLNTPREYFSPGSTPEFWRKETERLVKHVIDKDIALGNADKPVRVFKSEIIAVLGVGTFRQKQMAYAMLITSKRYGKTFFLTRNTAKQMIGATSNETVQTAIKQLVEVGFIEYVRRGEIDQARSRETGQRRHKPNKYKILIATPETGEASIETKGNDLIEAVKALVPMKEQRLYIGRKELKTRWA